LARLLHLLWLFVLLASGAGSAAAALNDYPFRIQTVPQGGLDAVTARNDGPAPITVYVSLKSENVDTTVQWPLSAVVPAHTALTLGYIAPVDANVPYRYLFNYTYYVGRMDAAPDSEVLYRYPFPDGQAHAITQAYGGRLTSHDNKQNRYAVDFDMPVGTPVLAAREGMVVDVLLKYRSGGEDPSFLDQANIVTIVHDDGTLAEYAHLSPGPALVARGQRVEAGQLIGYSGNTGYSTGPHLHFVVSRPEVDHGKVIRLSLPVAFHATQQHIAVAPRAGALADADYGDGTAMYAAHSEPPRVAATPSGDAGHPPAALGSIDHQ